VKERKADDNRCTVCEGNMSTGFEVTILPKTNTLIVKAEGKKGDSGIPKGLCFSEHRKKIVPIVGGWIESGGNGRKTKKKFTFRASRDILRCKGSRTPLIRKKMEKSPRATQRRGLGGKGDKNLAQLRELKISTAGENGTNS